MYEKKLKVLEIISALSPVGGSETFAVNFCVSMKEKADVRIVVLHNEIHSLLANRLQKNNFEITVLDKKKHFDIKTLRQLRKIIIKYKPDVIHREQRSFDWILFLCGASYSLISYSSFASAT